MALGKKCQSSSSSLKRSVSFGVVSEVKAFGRKRVEATNEFSKLRRVLKKQRSECFDFCFGFEEEDVSKDSKLEAMPQEILIKILCGVEHEDLKQLFHVSKDIKEATVVAKKEHFEYSTPRKIDAFRTKIDFSEDSDGELDEIEAPDAPMRRKKRRVMPCRRKLEEISVNLLDSLEDGTRRGLFMDEDDDE